jgi:hypothetical protein
MGTKRLAHTAFELSRVAARRRFLAISVNPSMSFAPR